MAKKVVIVESPSKSKTISKYLGKDYLVTASVGHIRDLATSGKGGLGIDVDQDFKPDYQVLPNKIPVVKELNSLIKSASEIFLATDPDREGEAISWHLYDTLNIKNKEIKRVVFNEITKDAILAAFEHPRDIDMDLVSSQETRRMLDRIIGFKLSMLLKSKIKSKSAGRVQSAALKLIVDLEKEIDKFIPEEYFEISAKFGDIDADLFKINNKKPHIPNQKTADEVVDNLNDEFSVRDLSVKDYKSYARPALTTSTLAQYASNKFNYSSEKTMTIAQVLYEGLEYKGELVGLITYMRSDSTRLSFSFVDEAKKYIKDKYGSDYVGYYRAPKKKGNTQDAHEAIRPTSLLRTPEEFKAYLEDSNYKDHPVNKGENTVISASQLYNIYKLIYDKAVGSLMSPAVSEVTTLLLENNNTIFKATSSKPKFDGYLKLSAYYDEEDEKKILDLSKFKIGETYKADEIVKKRLFTSPPARYTEAKLIKEMEDLGIGRPSTYSSTISTIIKRKYVSLKERKFVPTDQGKLTVEKLDQFFHEFISSTYSKNMEDTLDEIAEGKIDQLNVLSEFYDYFIPLIEDAKDKMDKVKPVKTGEMCPKCGHPMVYKTGKYGQFEACSNFPKCKYIKPNENEKPKAKDTEVKCPECGIGTLVVRVAGKGKNKGNKFLGCSRYPKCKYISPLKIVEEECPDCHNVVVKDELDQIHCIDGKSCNKNKH